MLFEAAVPIVEVRSFGERTRRRQRSDLHYWILGSLCFALAILIVLTA